MSLQDTNMQNKQDIETLVTMVDDLVFASEPKIGAVVKAWSMFKKLFEEENSRNIYDLAPSQSEEAYAISNFLNELPYLLMNEGAYSLLIEIGEYLLTNLDFEDELMLSNWQREIASSYNEVGNPEKCDALYEKYIDENPTCGNLYFGYCLLLEGRKEIDKLFSVMHRFFDLNILCQETELLIELGQRVATKIEDKEWLKEVSARCQASTSPNQKLKSKGYKPQLPLELSAYENALPNKPCPCGSGKRFKSCCKKTIDKMDAGK